MDNGTNINGSTRGGTTSIGRDEDRWTNGQIIGAGPTGGGAIVGADDGSFRIVVTDPPSLGMNISDLLLILLL